MPDLTPIPVLYGPRGLRGGNPGWMYDGDGEPIQSVLGDLARKHGYPSNWVRTAMSQILDIYGGLRRDAESSGRLQPGDHHVCTLNLDGGPSLLVGTSAAIRAALE